MGLFDNLFKNKPDPGEEGVVEAARRITEAEKARLIEAEKAAKAQGQKNHGSGNRSAHAPVARAYSPRSLGQAVPPQRPLAPAKGPLKAARFGAAAEGGRPQEIRLLLDDVLPRIPHDLLNDAPRDGRKEIRFRVEDVTADIARGRAAVALIRIAEQVPEIFRESVASGDETLIRLPLQKLVEQIGFLPVKPALESKSARPSGQQLPPAMPPAAAPTVFKPIAPPPTGREFPEAPSPVRFGPVERKLPVMEQSAPTPGSGPSKRRISEPPVPAPEFQAAGVGGDAKISLNLATVLRNCPKELICSSLPPIAETEQIEVAFGAVEKQLPTGQVEISSVRFVFALPPHLQHCFEAREGVRIPLPLEEVLRNLPNVGAATAPELEPPVSAAGSGTHPTPAQVTPTELQLAAAETGSSVDKPQASEPPTVEEASSDKAPEFPGERSLHSEAREITLSDEEVTHAASAITDTLVPQPSLVPSSILPDEAKVESQEIEETVPGATTESEVISTLESQTAGAALQSGERALSESRSSLSIPGFSLESRKVEKSVVSEEAGGTENEPGEIQYGSDQPGVAFPVISTALPASMPPAVATVIPPPLFGGMPAENSEVGVSSAVPVPESAPAELPTTIPLLGRIVPPPPVQLTPPPGGLLAPPEPPLQHVPAVAPAESAPVEGEGTSAAEKVDQPLGILRNPSASPFVPPPVFPVPTRPLSTLGTPSVTREAPHIDPPPSPILPVRLVSPPVLRPVVAPPPLFGTGLSEEEAVAESPATIHWEVAAAPEPPPAPLPPRPLELSKACRVLGLPAEADLNAIGEKLSRLPGLDACLLTARHETADAGEIPGKIDRIAVRTLASRVAESVSADAAIGVVQNVTLFTSEGCMSVFARGHAMVCALHRTRAFLPGVCDTLTAVVEALDEA